MVIASPEYAVLCKGVLAGVAKLTFTHFDQNCAIAPRLHSAEL